MTEPIKLHHTLNYRLGRAGLTPKQQQYNVRNNVTNLNDWYADRMARGDQHVIRLQGMVGTLTTQNQLMVAVEAENERFYVCTPQLEPDDLVFTVNKLNEMDKN